MGARARNHVGLGFVFGSRSSKEEKAAATDKVSADLSQPRDPQAPQGPPYAEACCGPVAAQERGGLDRKPQGGCQASP
ncbi:hypothetical protein GCM10020254_59520 [Streptomyces goshikiensis]